MSENIYDKTSSIEDDIRNENKPKLKYLIRLFLLVFKNAKVMCAIYITLMLILSLLQPVIAFVWGKYIGNNQNYITGNPIFGIVVLLLIYYVINYIIDLLSRYTSLYGEKIEKLNLVQVNRFQEQFDTYIFKKIAKLPPEYMEIPKINDTMQRVFSFTSDAWGGVAGGVMLQGYD